ncbi:sulfite exporter TauE/SafE family protein [Acidovorax sp. GBBC 3334]|uniref:sulfite exporter TauE/SafE family protein n=1 Tax=Acidovorax sp. GBBC 3334 TaxID=2940496 RepID=UPI002303EC3D|nr:sulfite exporter TauE/SafE family protein [Acidovorax sp. GBBC 3334]MDA8454198.1 sulfite exporter TauE/SafE family protein [Acidovorax sp. GBBC 3334]
MPDALVWTAFAMGLAGGPHCLAMCAAPCAALIGGPGRSAAAEGAPVRWMAVPVGGGGAARAALPPGGAPPATAVRTAYFHLARLAGYATAGAAAALAMDRLAWLTQQSAALRPVWTLLHVGMLAWGLLMALQARQPAWVERAGRAVWARIGPRVRAPGGVAAAGLAWALMPCGLLYSALLVAALGGSPWRGAAAMAAFGVGGMLWLVGGTWAWRRLRSRVDAARATWGTRVAGALLVAVAAWALWMDVWHHTMEMWCR